MKTRNDPDPRTLLANMPVDLRQYHTTVLAARANLEALRRGLLVQIETFEVVPLGHVNNARARLTAFYSSELARNFVTAETVLSALENSPRFKEADALIAPLLAAVAKLEAEEETAHQEQLRTQAELAKARETAQQRAIVAAEKDPAVIAAKRKVEKAASWEPSRLRP
jgi:hypothetical protein